jgi:hypothetical protein
MSQFFGTHFSQFFPRHLTVRAALTSRQAKQVDATTGIYQLAYQSGQKSLIVRMSDHHDHILDGSEIIHRAPDGSILERPKTPKQLTNSFPVENWVTPCSRYLL